MFVSQHTVTATEIYKGATLEHQEYPPHGNKAVVATYGRDYIGSFHSVSTAKRAVTAYLKRGTPPT